MTVQSLVTPPPPTRPATERPAAFPLAVAAGHAAVPSGPCGSETTDDPMARLDAVRRRGGVAVVEGAGHADLLARVGSSAERAGVVVLAGWCASGTTAPLSVLYDAAGCTDLLDPLLAAEADLTGPSAGGKQQAYRRLRSALADLPAPDGVLLACADLQWADPASLDVLAALIRGRAVGVALLLGARTGQVPAVLERALSVVADVTRFRPADRATVRTLPSAGPADPAIALDAGVPAEWRTLTATERRVAAAAAVLGTDLDSNAVAAVAEVDEPVAAAALDLLGELDVLLTEPMTGPDGAVLPAGGARFADAPTRAAAYRLAGPSWRVAAHRRAAALLQTRGAQDIAIAPHVAAGAVGGDHGAYHLLVRAAADHTRQDPAAVCGWLTVALRIRPADAGDDADAVRLALATARLSAGDLVQARADLQALRSRPGTQHAAAVLLLARTEQELGRLDEARDLLTGELADHDVDPVTAAAAVTGLAALDVLRHRCPAPADGSIPLPPGPAAVVRTVEALAALGRGDDATGPVTAAAEAVDALSPAEYDGVLDQVHLLGWALLHSDQLVAAERQVARAGAALSRSGRSTTGPCQALLAGLVHTRLGQLPSALRSAEEAAETAARLGPPDAVVAAAATALLPRLWREGPAGVTDLLPVASRYAEIDSPWSRSLAAGLYAEALLTLDRPADAAAAAEAAVRAAGSLGDPQRPRLLALAATAALRLGDLAAATTAAQSAVTAAERSGLVGQRAAANLALARVQGARREFSAARATADAALTDAERSGQPVLVVTALTLRAELAAGCGDVDHARADLLAAQQRCLDISAGWLAGLAGEAAARLTTSPPTTARRAVPGGEPLSNREQEIAELVCEGLTNKAIAARLFLSVRTVDTHVARILTKLGVANRLGVLRMLDSA